MPQSPASKAQLATLQGRSQYRSPSHASVQPCNSRCLRTRNAFEPLRTRSWPPRPAWSSDSATRRPAEWGVTGSLSTPDLPKPAFSRPDHSRRRQSHMPCCCTWCRSSHQQCTCPGSHRRSSAQARPGTPATSVTARGTIADCTDLLSLGVRVEVVRPHGRAEAHIVVEIDEVLGQPCSHRELR